MSDFWACVADEFQALGAWCVIHGPEIWLMIAQIAIGLAIFNAGILVGMYIAALMRANGRNEDENKRDL